ncbi:MAG: hypothetical protein GY842_17805 [bacterium]|nr:hypothetical protein [bacterium]
MEFRGTATVGLLVVLALTSTVVATEKFDGDRDSGAAASLAGTVVAAVEGARCQGVGWPMGHQPQAGVVEPPSSVLELRSAPSFPESHLPPLDAETLRGEDQPSQRIGQPLRIGITRDLDIDASHGAWTELPGSGGLWTAAVVLEGAWEVRLHFTGFQLPQGAELYVYAPGALERVHGPYTGTGPLRTEEFWAGSVAGDTVYIEYLAPRGAAGVVPFRIDSGGHVYRPLEELGDDGGLRADLSCMKDVACYYPTWESVSYSVAKITYHDGGYIWLCTGQLLASQSGDLTPYFLTSAHCVDTESQADGMEFRWFYQRSTCNGTLMGSSFSYEADVLETSHYSGSPVSGDWTLMMVLGALPTGVYWTGWTAGTVGDSAVGVHHPDGSYKRYSRGVRLNETAYWQRIAYNQNVGTILGGSSGSGIWTNELLPENQLLYGNCSFSYGDVSCSNPANPVYYGKFSYYYPEIASLLSGGSEDAYEGNDACASAVALSNGTYYDLVLKSVAEDWYRISVGSSEQLEVALSFVDAHGDVNVALYDGCGGAVVASSTTTTDDELLTYPNGGPSASFYLRVYLADDTRNTYAMSVSGAFLDCNTNGLADPCEIDCGPPGGICDVPGCGQADDCNSNSVPDECESQSDCQPNGFQDICDIGQGTSMDCQGNGVPDECEMDGNDCNSNGVPDVCDAAGATSADCQPNSIPDECEIEGNDCNNNGVPDVCDAAGATSFDCQPNNVPDECELAGNDCDSNAVPDECDPDCNTNGQPDACDVALGISPDCNNNGQPDECDVTECSSLWDGFQPNPPFSRNILMSTIDYLPYPDGDGIFWENPEDTAIIDRRGCETGYSSDLSVRVDVDESLFDPRDGYVASELFRTVEGTPAPEENVYTLTFSAKVGFGIDAKWDWEYLVYDTLSGRPVVQIEFASLASEAVDPGDRGYILVKNPAGSPVYFNTGVGLYLDQCYDLEVTLDNVVRTVTVSIDGDPVVATEPLYADARRMDYFRVHPSANGASTSSTTNFKVDGFQLCVTGMHPVPDCNANAVFDECDIAEGTSGDCNSNGVPDECGAMERGDFDGDDDVDLLDFEVLLSCFTGCCIAPPCDPPLYSGACCPVGDADSDGDVDLADYKRFQAEFNQ